jgi:hypothetical protein
VDKKCKQKNYFVSGIDLPTFRFDANVMTAEPKGLFIQLELNTMAYIVDQLFFQYSFQKYFCLIDITITGSIV